MSAQLLPPPGNLLAFAAPALPPELTAELAPSNQPLLMLPVRLETRFFALPGGMEELRVRVYPDQIHVDTHEPDLSPEEREWGEHFWEQFSSAGQDKAAQQRAWQQLADRFDARRAAWIAHALRPKPEGSEQPQASAAPISGESEGGAWQRAPLARLMPQRWIAVASTGGALVAHALGKPIDQEPAVGPDPHDKTEPPAGEPALDPGMRWMVDFKVAEEQGMALRLTLPAQVARAGIDSLVVFGVSSLGEADSSAKIAELLDAHHYTDGLGFLRVGTPTNNSVEAPSGWSSRDPLHVRSFEIECQAAPITAGSNAARLGEALGLDATVNSDDTVTSKTLGRLYDAALAEQEDAKQMATALWPATWGYYLLNMIGFDSTGLTLDSIGWAREHFINHVRAFGPLPTLRIGRQPYGVLPVTPLAGAGVVDANERWLATTLKGLLDRLWHPRVPDVPRVGRSNDPAQDLTAVLKSDGVSSTYRLRHLLGPRYIEHLRRFMGEAFFNASGWLAAQERITRAVLQNLGLPWHPRLEGAAYAEAEIMLNAPLVQAGKLDGLAALNPDYIKALVDDPPLPTSETSSPPAMPAPATLLHLLLRHSVQLEYTAAAARMASNHPNAVPLANLLRERELVNLNDQTDVTTWRRLLSHPTPATGGASLASFLKSQESFESFGLKPLGELRDALKHLQGLSPERLERLLTGTLDVASHRLDAWISSLASRRLAAMRSKEPTGLRIGGYGWVLNLKLTDRQTPVPTPADETGDVFAMRDDTGFIHAPSVVQAETAALLRNAHLTHSHGDALDLFAVDLSSRRVRLATHLLDGVRQGQPLGALLGYLFERRLHELRLDDTIDDFRRLAPIAPVNATPDAQPAESIAARNVVDGLKLREINLEMKRSEPGTPGQNLFKRCAVALNLLEDAVDAVSDAAVAECAHQAVRGNVGRTATTLQAIASGEAPPPELDVARTPRSGLAVAHRVVALFNAVKAPASPVSPRAVAEPQLDAWAALLLGPLKNIRFAVERRGPEGSVIETVELRLNELAIAPIDVVYFAPARPGDPMPEIDARALAAGAAKLGAPGVGETLQLNRRRGANWLPIEIGLDELAELAARARALFTGLRAIDARDLVALQQTVEAGTDGDEFDRRALTARESLATALAELQSELAAAAAPDTTTLREAIVGLSRFGIPGSSPLDSTDPEAFMAQGAAVAREAARRVDLAKAASSPLDVLRAVFGPAFLALPQFMLPDVAELEQSLAATKVLQGGNALTVYPWFQQAQRVREPLSRLGASLHAAEVAGTGARMHLSVAQLPHVSTDRWLGLPQLPKGDMPAGRLSIVVHAAATLDLSKPLAGVLIDEWVEVVPSSTETTAITFQHDAPDSRAPQAMLLAVPATPGEPWTVAGLHRLLLDTLALAQVRAVDAEALDTAVLNPLGARAVGEVSHFLPALHFAVNVDGDAVSPDFRPLTS